MFDSNTNFNLFIFLSYKNSNCIKTIYAVNLKFKFRKINMAKHGLNHEIFLPRDGCKLNTNGNIRCSSSKQ